MRTFLDTINDKICQVVQVGDMDLITDRIKTLEEMIEQKEEFLMLNFDMKFKEFFDLEIQMLKAELFLLLGHEWKFTGKSRKERKNIDQDLDN